MDDTPPTPVIKRQWKRLPKLNQRTQYALGAFFIVSATYTLASFIRAYWDFLLASAWTTAAQYAARRLYQNYQIERQRRADENFSRFYDANRATLEPARWKRYREAALALSGGFVLDVLTFFAGHEGGGYVVASLRTFVTLVVFVLVFVSVGAILYAQHASAADDDEEERANGIISFKRLQRAYRDTNRVNYWVAVCICGAIAATVTIIALTNDRGAYIRDPALPSYARQGEEAVHFTERSLPISCRELRTNILHYTASVAPETVVRLPMRELSLSKLRGYAEYMLLHAHVRDVCTCAPMFGARRRHVALRRSMGDIAERVVHMYNPELDTAWFRTWRGVNDDPTTRYALNSEQQRVLFPEREGTVKVIRANAVRVQFMNESCAQNVVTLEGTHAWCVQSCLDLLDGISVYDKGGNANHKL